MKERILIINATASKLGGALTILRDFLAVVRTTDNKSMYYIFTGADLNEFVCDNIRIINIKTHGFGIGGIKRIIWDSFGLFAFCIFKKIKPDLIISFQNTGVLYPGVKQLIYYHQSIPLFDNKWKFYKKDEFALFLYKYIYPHFVRVFKNADSEIVVQTESIKKRFLSKFEHSDEKVHVISPDINVRPISQIALINLDKSRFHIFYPTNYEKYKNYEILFEAIAKIKEKHPEISGKLILHITLDKNNRKVTDRVHRLDIMNNVNFLGSIPQEDVFSYYKSVNLLVFPSYIETVGIPLVEAASFGLSILAADLDYAHEALKNYMGVTFVEFDKPGKWADAIIDISTKNHRIELLKVNPVQNSWRKFLELSMEIIENA